MKNIRRNILLILGLGLMLTAFSCSKKSGGGDTPVTPTPPVTPVTPQKTDVSMLVTAADQSQLLAKQNVSLLFSTATNQNTIINVDTTQTYQSIDGFGFCLSG